MTEDEAKTKWCQQALAKSGDVAFNRYASTPPDVTPPNANCLGSQCMAWRWASEKNDAYVPTSPMTATSYQHPADMQSPWRKSTTEGYCGLAGQP